MKRKAKRILGSCGLLAVGLTTTFAAFLPVPSTSAVSSVSDTITLTVYPNSPWVEVSGVDPVVVKSKQDFVVKYSGAETVEVAIDYAGNSMARALGHVAYLDTIQADYQTGQKRYPVNLKNIIAEDSERFSYGDYLITAVAEGYGDSVPSTASLSFEYVPVKAFVEENEMDSTYHIILDYEYDKTSEDGDVDKIVITVTDQDGNKHEIEVKDGDTDVVIPFEDYMKDDGKDYTFTVTVVAYDDEGEEIYRPFTTEEVKISATPNTSDPDDPNNPNNPTNPDNPNKPSDPNKPDKPGEDIPVPDTGVFTGMLNISKTDYLVTGAIIFGVVVVAGIVFVLKGGKQNSKRK